MFILTEFSRRLTRAIVYVMQTLIDPDLPLCNDRKHLFKYFRPYIWPMLRQADRIKPSLQSFKKAIRKKNPQDLV